MARLNVESTRSDMENQVITVVNNVKSACYNVLQAKRRREVNVEVRNQYRRPLIKTRFRVGQIYEKRSCMSRRKEHKT